MRRTIAVALTALAVVVGLAGEARANGRYPNATELVVMPGASGTMFLRATFGPLISRDSGRSWDWVCENAVGYGSMNEDPSYGITASGVILGATFEGLALSPDGACSWSMVQGGLAKQLVIDLVVRPNDPHSALAMTSTYAGDGGATLYSSQIFATHDDGTTWTPYGTPVDPTVIVTTLEVAVSDPHRVYVGGMRGEGSSRTAAIFVSMDDATTWMEHPITLDPTNEDGVYVSGVDPSNPDRVYVRTALGANVPRTPPNTSPARLLASSNAGAMFTVAYTGQGPLFGFALSADGSKVYVGGVADGVQVAPSTTLAFAETSTAVVQCLTVAGGSLYVCGHAGVDPLLGVSTDDGARITPVLAQLCDIRGPIACPAGTSAAVCTDAWPMLHDQTFECPPPDAGTDGGGPGGPPPASKSCGCRLAGGGAGTGWRWVAATLALALALVARRRRQSRAPEITTRHAML